MMDDEWWVDRKTWARETRWDERLQRRWLHNNEPQTLTIVERRNISSSTEWSDVLQRRKTLNSDLVAGCRVQETYQQNQTQQNRQLLATNDKRVDWVWCVSSRHVNHWLTEKYVHQSIYLSTTNIWKTVAVDYTPWNGI